MKSSPRIRVALVLIGDEVLSGKVQDANTPFAIRFLRSKGLTLAEVVMVPDIQDEISDTVRRLSAKNDWVVTSGGVGPTHDDVTMAAVADAFGAELVQSPELEDLLTGRGKPMTEGVRLLARVPEGYCFHWGNGRQWPVVGKENTVMLPGVPSVFRSCLEAVFWDIAFQARFVGSVCLNASETELVHLLAAIQENNPGVDIGSYPKFEGQDHSLQITFEADLERPIQAAMETFLGAIDTERVTQVNAPTADPHSVA